jgi:uncharacterized protein YndB with AHSA1/START domain
MTYRETFALNAPAPAVFDALTDPAILSRWLAEHAEVEAHKGGVFRFWGRDVIWCEAESESEGEVVALAAPRKLEIRWRWQGHTTRVAFELAERGDRTELTIEHRFESFDPGPTGPGPDMAGCHWRIAMGNLACVLAGRTASLRPDYTRPPNDGPRSVELEIEINAPVERVFEALLDPAQVRVWMGVDEPEIETGTKRYSYGWRREEREVGPMQILELIPNRLLVHDWHWTGEPEGQVRWELSPTDSGTRLRLVHLESVDYTHTLGWADAMQGIRRLLER